MVKQMNGLFDRNILKQKRIRCLGHLNDAGFLLEHTGRVLINRLDDIKRDFPITLQLGGRDNQQFSATVQEKAKTQLYIKTDLITDTLGRGDVCIDEEILPFKSKSIDLIVSNLCLHSTNDLPGVLIQARHALKADGLFIASMLGGETLYELRQSLMQAEIKLSGGASPRIMPFADKPQMGDLLRRAGFSLPVIDSDIVTVSYENIFKLMQDLRGMGESSIIADRQKNFTRRELFLEAEKYYHENFAEEGNRIKASFEIIYLIGWAPHESQQQPLRPGSAKNRLADALNTKEETI